MVFAGLSIITLRVSGWIFNAAMQRPLSVENPSKYPLPAHTVHSTLTTPGKTVPPAPATKAPVRATNATVRTGPAAPSMAIGSVQGNGATAVTFLAHAELAPHSVALGRANQVTVRMQPPRAVARPCRRPQAAVPPCPCRRTIRRITPPRLCQRNLRYSRRLQHRLL
jgi:hypothetical protein